MSAFGGSRRSNVARRRQSPWLTVAAIVVLAIIGLESANRARQQRQEGPQAPPIRVPAEPGSQAEENQQEAVNVVRVVDGDTLLLEQGVRVRFLGVNTPEIAHDDQPEEPLGREAKEFTRKFLEGKRVTLEYDQERKDDYGRTLAYVYADGKMLNEALIESGLSEAVTRHSYRPDRKRLFEAAEERAFSKKIGIWGQTGRRPR